MEKKRLSTPRWLASDRGTSWLGPNVRSNFLAARQPPLMKRYRAHAVLQCCWIARDRTCHTFRSPADASKRGPRQGALGITCSVKIDLELLHSKAWEPPSAAPAVVQFVTYVTFGLMLKPLQLLALRIAQAAICAKFDFLTLDSFLLGTKL